MNILISGAFGNIGCMVMDELIRRGHHITAFDLKTKTNLKLARKYESTVTVAWGDITKEETVKSHTLKADAIIHLAAVLPPFTEINPSLAQEINVGGTKTMLKLAKDSGSDPIFIFASSFAVFGTDQTKAPPRNANEPLEATDNYSSQKILCENLIKDQSLPWVILRLGACLDSRQRHAGKEMIQLAFDTNPDNRLEYIHPKDVALAMANSLSNEEAHRKVLLIGGGKHCQITQYDLINTMMGAAGLKFKRRDFGSKPFYTDWLDTSESQQILNFQNHSFEDFRREAFQSMKLVRPIVKVLATPIRIVFLLWLRGLRQNK